jgi:hypothetical protein
MAGQVSAGPPLDPGLIPKPAPGAGYSSTLQPIGTGAWFPRHHWSSPLPSEIDCTNSSPALHALTLRQPCVWHRGHSPVVRMYLLNGVQCGRMQPLVCSCSACCLPLVDRRWPGTQPCMLCIAPDGPRCCGRPALHCDEAPGCPLAEASQVTLQAIQDARLLTPQVVGTFLQHLADALGASDSATWQVRAWCCLILCDIASYCLVQVGAAWYCMVLLGAVWCCLVLLGAAWCCLVLLGTAGMP